MESRFSIWLKSCCAGATCLMSLTSFGAFVAAARSGPSLSSFVWIDNPFGSSVLACCAWHLTLVVVFCYASVLLLRPLFPQRLRVPFLGLRRPRAHLVVAVVLAGLCLFALKDTAVFYWLLARGRITSDLRVPLSLFLFAVLFVITTLVWDIPLPACRPWWRAGIIGLTGFVFGSVGLVLLHLVTFGTTDYTRRADVAIVLGAKVYAEGVPSRALSDRLRTAIELYESGHVDYLLMTGGTGKEGISEARVMRQVALDAGVPEDRILMDEYGMNTRASARNCRRVLDERGLASALVVSHYYHLARCKLAFAEQGVCCATVPARMSMRLIKEPYYVLRECIAYVAYAVHAPWHRVV